MLRSADRAAIQAKLRAAGIATGIHYPMPVHTQPAYKGRIALGPAACRASEIASAVAWLASEEGGYSTGADFSVNGGLHMG